MDAKITGLHTTYRTLASGNVAIYAYSTRNGPLVCRAEGRDRREAKAELHKILGLTETLTRLSELRKPLRTQPPSAENIAGLIKLYVASAQFEQLKPKTRSEYERYLRLFEKEFGGWPTRAFEAHQSGRDILEWRDFIASGKPRASDYMISTVSRLFSWARSQYHTNADPTADIETLYRSDRSEIIWTDDELKKVIDASATDELRHAIRLAAATGLRQGDLLSLSWNAIDRERGVLVHKTSKKGIYVHIPLGPLLQILNEIPKRSTTILTSSRNRPWTNDGLRSSFDAAKKKAKIEGKHWHDLRGTAATKLFLHGLKAEEIARWMGWSEPRCRNMLNIYVAYGAVAEERIFGMNQEHSSQTADKPGDA